MGLPPEPAPLLDRAPAPKASLVQLPAMPALREVLTDYSTTGLSLKQHPVAFARSQLDRMHIVPARQLQDERRFPHGAWVRVAGLVLVRQRPGTASGVVFITLEDETGVANLILWSHIYERHRAVARHATLLHAEGLVQREGKVVHVLSKRLYDQTHRLQGVAQQSRDFH